MLGVCLGRGDHFLVRQKQALGAAGSGSCIRCALLSPGTVCVSTPPTGPSSALEEAPVAHPHWRGPPPALPREERPIGASTGPGYGGLCHLRDEPKNMQMITNGRCDRLLMPDASRDSTHTADRNACPLRIWPSPAVDLRFRSRQRK